MNVDIQQQKRLERVSLVHLQCDRSALLRQCASWSCELTIMAAVRGIVERIASLPIVPPWCGRRRTHLLLVVTLKLIHDCGVARMLRDDREARLLK